MISISLIIVLNISIILMMIVVFSNITFVYQIQSSKVYQLVDDLIPDYDKYMERKMKSYEKKLEIDHYFNAIYNVSARRIPLPGVKYNEFLRKRYFFCASEYVLPDFAVQEHYIDKFEIKIEDFLHCLAPNVLKKIKNASFDKIEPKEDDTSISGCSTNSAFEDENSNRSIYKKYFWRNSINTQRIKVIDNELQSDQINLYDCFQKFKNDVFELNIKFGQYPKKKTNIKIDKYLSLNNKQKILTDHDITFLRSIKINDDGKLSEGHRELFTSFTNYRFGYLLIHDGKDFCMRKLWCSVDERKFKLTQLTRQYIYPSQSDDLSSYKKKRKFIINTLEKLDQRVQKYEKEIYNNLEVENKKLDQPYYNLMRKCRALSKEDEYRVYVIRLYYNGCIPLSVSMWEDELRAAKNTQPMLLEAIQMKLVGNAFTVIQHKEIPSLSVLKKILEESYCATRTPEYLQLELSTTRFRQGESVQQYASRVEKLLSELCNVSTSRKSTTEAKIINDYIKEVTLTTFVEGLPNSIRRIIKSRNFQSIEEAMKGSLEEDKIYQSNKEAQWLMQNKPSTSGNSKYCKQCRKSNHNTNECKYANRNMGTGQQNKHSIETKETGHKRLTCAYCRKPGHLLEDCFKKKNADGRKLNNDGQTSSGNDKRTDTAGDRPVRELKVIAQHQKF